MPAAPRAGEKACGLRYSSFAGGRSAAREVCEMIMLVQDTLHVQQVMYLK